MLTTLCLHPASWYPHRLDDNVLWLHFEDLKEDLPGVIRKIAKFLDIGADDNELLELVEKQVRSIMHYTHTRANY